MALALLRGLARTAAHRHHRFTRRFSTDATIPATPPPPPPRFTIEKSALPQLPRFESGAASLHLIRDASSAIPAAARASFERDSLIGLDTESGIADKRIRLVQLATAEHVLLFQLRWQSTGGRHGRLVPPECHPFLAELLNSNEHVKVGQDPCYEMVELDQLLGTQSTRVADVAYLARRLDTRPWNLQALTGIFLGRFLSKSQQVSRWEKEQLTDEQLEYAACDALVCRAIFLECLRVYQEDHGLSSRDEAMEHSGCVIGAYEDDSKDIACSCPDECTVPREYDEAFFSDPAIKPPRQLLAELLSGPLRCATPPEWEKLDERPEGAISRVRIPGLGVEFSHTRPYPRAQQGRDLAALKAYHALHEPGKMVSVKQTARNHVYEIMRKYSIPLASPEAKRVEEVVDGKKVPVMWRTKTHLRYPTIAPFALNEVEGSYTIDREFVGEGKSISKANKQLFDDVLKAVLAAPAPRQASRGRVARFKRRQKQMRAKQQLKPK